MLVVIKTHGRHAAPLDGIDIGAEKGKIVLPENLYSRLQGFDNGVVRRDEHGINSSHQAFGRLVDFAGF